MLEKTKPIKRRNQKRFSFLKIRLPAYLAFLIGCGVGFVLYPSLELKEQSPALLTSNVESTIRVCFSPEGQCTSQIQKAIAEAKSSIFVQAYSFTSAPIAQALVDAHARGVEVSLLIDKSQLTAHHSQLHFLLQNGISAFIDPAAGIAHNKVLIIDNKHVLTGSFNWTHAAECKNAENLLFIDDSSLAQVYKQNWQTRARQAKQIFLSEAGQKTY